MTGNWPTLVCSLLSKVGHWKNNNFPCYFSPLDSIKRMLEFLLIFPKIHTKKYWPIFSSGGGYLSSFFNLHIYNYHLSAEDLYKSTTGQPLTIWGGTGGPPCWPERCYATLGNKSGISVNMENKVVNFENKKSWPRSLLYFFLLLTTVLNSFILCTKSTIHVSIFLRAFKGYF